MTVRKAKVHVDWVFQGRFPRILAKTVLLIKKFLVNNDYDARTRERRHSLAFVGEEDIGVASGDRTPVLTETIVRIARNR